MSGDGAEYINGEFGGLTLDQQRNWDMIFGGNESQNVLLAKLPYFDHNGNEKFIVGAVYNVVYEMLPPVLPTLLPPLQLQGPQPYAIRDVPGKGKGMIATRDIALGEIVLVERPVLIFPLALRRDVVTPFREYAKRSMDPEDWKEFMNLVNVKNSDVPTFDGIMTTNAFTIELRAGKECYSGVFLQISRINHSCGPNIECIWDPHLFAFSAQAVRPIRAGQELTVTYEDPCKSHTDRRLHLQRIYKFKCQCGYCTKTSPSSDQDRYYSNPDVATPAFEVVDEKLLGPDVPRHVGHQEAKYFIKMLMKGLDVVRKEGIESVSALLHYEHLMTSSGLLADKKSFKEWGFKAVLLSLKNLGTGGENVCRQVEQWIDWVKDPERNFPGWGRFQ